MLLDLEARVMEIYHRADHDVAEYQLFTGLACPLGCVICCNSEKVEATVAEMVPLASHLFRTNQAELLLKRLSPAEQRKSCILFRPDLAGSIGGGCSQYPFRALVCRLFGFAGNIDKRGEQRFSPCRIMKGASSLAALQLENQYLPHYQNYGVAISALHPSLGEGRKPINLALREALLKVGLSLELEKAQLSANESCSPQDEPFDRPTLPHRRAA